MMLNPSLARLWLIFAFYSFMISLPQAATFSNSF